MARVSYKDFNERFEARKEELHYLYNEIYQDENAYEYFVSMLKRMYGERSSELKKWDKKRLKDEDWYKGNDILGMLMYVDCFADTIKGVEKHLDYLKDCGINYLHMMPLLASPKGESDGGYAVSDFRKVDEKLGTMEDLAHLAQSCHESGISICLDFVMNHTSKDHEWAKRARNGEKGFQDRYFFFDNWDIPNQFEKSVPEVFPTTAPGNFSWCEEAQKVVMTTFYPYQWDLNYRNPTVFNDMSENMLYLCNQGVDVIRLDAVPYIWKSLGTNCRNLPEVHKLVRMMRIASEIVCPSALLLGEVVMEPSKVVPYFGSVETPECHMLYNVTTMASTWHTVATRDVRLLKHQLESVFALPKQYTFLNYLRCHDDIGWGLDYDYLKQFGIEEVAHKRYLNSFLRGHEWGSESRGELYNDDPRLGDARLCGTTASLCGLEAALAEGNDWKIEHALRLDVMLHAFLMSQSGIPVLYYGDEIGQLNDYSYHNDPDKKDDSRFLHRGKLDWKKVEEAKKVNTHEMVIYEAIASLHKVRSKYPLFCNSADTWILETYNDHVLGIGRYYEGEKLLALFNFSEHEQTAWINEEEDYTDLFSDEVLKAHNIEIVPHGFRWLYHDFNEKKGKSKK